MRYELRIALRYLRARRKDAFISITTIFTAVGVAIGVAALTITLAVMSGFQQSIEKRVLALSPQVQILNAAGSISDYAAIQAKAAKVRGVAGSDAYIVGQGMLSSGRGAGGVVVRGIESANPIVRGEWGKYIVKGQLADLARDYAAGGATPAPPKYGIAIGITLARRIKAKPGDAVRLVAPIVMPDGSLSTRTGEFAIGAIFDSGMNYIDANMVFMGLPRAQDFFGRPGNADGIDVHLAHFSRDETLAVTAALQKLFPAPFMVRNWIDYNESAAAGFALLRRVYAFVLTLLIGVAAFNLVAALIMIVMEKRKDIAVLIAMGATRRGIRTIFVLKGLIVGAIGTAAGLLAGALGCFALAHYHFIHIPRQIYGISTVPISADPSSFALVALASIVLCLLATLYPARQAAREMPADVFRS
ncbi:MAG: FtsX-like permease family protein [Candidatus Binataceae bacterium]